MFGEFLAGLHPGKTNPREFRGEFFTQGTVANHHRVRCGRLCAPVGAEGFAALCGGRTNPYPRRVLPGRRFQSPRCRAVPLCPVRASACSPRADGIFQIGHCHEVRSHPSHIEPCIGGSSCGIRRPRDAQRIGRLERGFSQRAFRGHVDRVRAPLQPARLEFERFRQARPQFLVSGKLDGGDAAPPALTEVQV